MFCEHSVTTNKIKCLQLEFKQNPANAWMCSVVIGMAGILPCRSVSPIKQNLWGKLWFCLYQHDVLTWLLLSKDNLWFSFMFLTRIELAQYIHFIFQIYPSLSRKAPNHMLLTTLHFLKLSREYHSYHNICHLSPHLPEQTQSITLPCSNTSVIHTTTAKGWTWDGDKSHYLVFQEYVLLNTFHSTLSL